MPRAGARAQLLLRAPRGLVYVRCAPAHAANRHRGSRPLAKAISNFPLFLVHSPKDNVGVVVVEDLKAGTDMQGVVTETDTTIHARANHDIPVGHKIALKALKKGDTVIKYGADIGRVVADAKPGDHVHTHNMKTKRW